MPITVTIDQTGAPTAIVTISTPDGSAMTAIALYRVVGGVGTLTRTQPAPGLASRVVTDVEIDWDTATSYSANVTFNGGASSAVYAVAAPIVSPSQAWAIHPTIPALSVPVDSGTFAAAGVVSIGSIARAANATKHRVIASPYAVPTKSGARNAAALSLTVATVTRDEAAAIRALVDDQTPLLIRVPSAWGWDWESGYYSVDDVSEDRPLMYGPATGRTFTLTLERTTAPAGTVQSDWSYPRMLTDFADYPSLRSGFSGYPAMTGNIRSS